MSRPETRRAELWYASVPGGKRRPVLVMTRDPMGRHLASVICAPVASTIRGISTELPLGVENGLAHPSVANFDNLLLLPRANLLRRLGRATDEQMASACTAVGTALGCRPRR